MSYINDTIIEYIKDVISQKIFYYPISELKTKTNIYNEAPEKVFDNPIIVDCLVGQPEWKNTDTKFGLEQTATLEIFVQAKDLLNKKLTLMEGDYFTYGDSTYEIITLVNMNNMYGLEEYDRSFKLIGKLSRIGEFRAKIFNPTKQSGDGFENDNGIQKVFEQQRGLPENIDGITNDKRETRERLGDDLPEIALGEGPRRIEPDEKNKSSKFRYEKYQ